MAYTIRDNGKRHSAKLGLDMDLMSTPAILPPQLHMIGMGAKGVSTGRPVASQRPGSLSDKARERGQRLIFFPGSVAVRGWGSPPGHAILA